MSSNSHNSAENQLPFKWNPQKEEAALLLAKNELTVQKIAEIVGVGNRTVGDWKERSEFCDRIREIQAEIRDRIRSRGIAVIENRVEYLDDRRRLMQQVISERALDPAMQGVAGGKTGLLCRTFKMAGTDMIDLYEFDAALLREMREHEKQAAQELGQWTEKKDHTTGGKPFKTFIDIDPAKE